MFVNDGEFLSPRRLNLRLYCEPKIPAKDTPDIWPALPLVIGGFMDKASSMNNIIAALGQSNHVHQVELEVAGWQLGEVLADMQVTFLEMTRMQLSSYVKTPPHQEKIHLLENGLKALKTAFEHSKSSQAK